MGYALTPIFFWNVNLPIGEVVSASRKEFLRFSNSNYTLGQMGQGNLEAYDDADNHYLFTYTDGEWFEFYGGTT